MEGNGATCGDEFPAKTISVPCHRHSVTRAQFLSSERADLPGRRSRLSNSVISSADRGATRFRTVRRSPERSRLEAAALPGEKTTGSQSAQTARETLIKLSAFHNRSS